MAESTDSPTSSALSSSQSNNQHVSSVIQSLNESAQKFFSFEYFPPRTKKTLSKLQSETLPNMAMWQPQWMDVTWGAGGTTSDLTPEICGKIQNELGVPCMMHLTCTNMAKEKIDEALAAAQSLGIRNILALRGDPPHGQAEWKAVDTGFSCALDLVRHIKAEYGDYFGITVAGYPEGHPSVRKAIVDEKWNPETNEDPHYIAPQKNDDGSWVGVSESDWKEELLYLKSKVEAGASVIITQLFYDVQLFVDFVREAREIGISVPILPGIMPVRNLALFKRMTGFCKTVVPTILSDRLEKANEQVKDGDQSPVLQAGLEWVSSMCLRILNEGIAPGIHIYTMNTELAPAMLLVSLGLHSPKNNSDDQNDVNNGDSAEVLTDSIITDDDGNDGGTNQVDLTLRIEELKRRDKEERRKAAEMKAIKEGKSIHSFVSL